MTDLDFVIVEIPGRGSFMYEAHGNAEHLERVIFLNSQPAHRLYLPSQDAIAEYKKARLEELFERILDR